MNINDLNRIKGILSAKQGTLVPKFLGGYVIYHKSTNKPLYSRDGTSWFTDENYTIIGGIDTDPNAFVKSAADINKQIAQETQDFRSQMAARENIIKLPTKSTADVLNSMNEPFTPPIRNASPVETNIKLDREDRKLARQTAYQEKVDALNAQATPEREENWNTALNVMDGISLVGNVVGATLVATDSDTTKTATAMYDGISSAMSQAGPYGKIVSGAMQAAKAIGDVAQWAGGGTDLQTKTDQWMDSPFFSWNIGLVNGFAGKNTLEFGADIETLNQVGSSYGGTATSINEAAESADKKYGLFSSKARKKANDAINKAKSQQNLMSDIAGQASDQRLAVQSMGEQAGIAYSMMTDGGYNQKYTYAAKKGGILEWKPDIILEWKPLIELNWELPEFKEGGNINIIEELEWTPKLQEGGKTRTIEELIEYAKKENPRFIQRMSEPLRFIRINFKDEDGNTSWAHATHEMNYKGKDVFSMIQEINGKLHRFDSEEEAYENAKKTNNILTFNSEEEAKLFAESGQNENGEYYGYKLGLQDFFNTSPEGLKEEYSINLYKQGGFIKDSDIPEIEETNLKNVIPEGALHKNKHHMEHAEGLTKKGIPVIDEDGEQQAEIEHSEIIFTLEVTKKLEEYYQIFYSEESSNKEKEQAALDAGKLLVYQILENTEDRTGLIDSCKKGGTLTYKISNDSIKEISEWIPNIVIIEKEFEKILKIKKNLKKII